MPPYLQKLLNELEKTRHQFWNINPETGQFLSQIIKIQQYSTAIEIGSSNGYSGIWIAEALTHTKGHLYTIESNLKKRYPLALQNFKKSKLTNITPILGHAPEAIPKNPTKFDLAFFDATKNEHLSYFLALAPRIKKEGMIITDNVLSHKKDLAAYLKHVQKQPDFTSFVINLGTGLLVSLKIPPKTS